MAQQSGSRQCISGRPHGCVQDKRTKTRENTFISNFSPSQTDIIVFVFRKITLCTEKTCRRQNLEAVGCQEDAAICQGERC